MKSAGDPDAPSTKKRWTATALVGEVLVIENFVFWLDALVASEV
jgi:hypothetical protein